MALGAVGTRGAQQAERAGVWGELAQDTQGRAGERCDTAAWSCDMAGGLGHNTARPGHDRTKPARTWACLGASSASFGAHAPGLFFDLVFDSVVFLSHRLDPVHEHCSSQNFSKFFFISKKKNQIKSN